MERKTLTGKENEKKMLCYILIKVQLKLAVLKKKSEGFSAGPMFKNLTCNAGNTGSIPSLGRYHMLQSN